MTTFVYKGLNKNSEIENIPIGVVRGKPTEKGEDENTSQIRVKEYEKGIMRILPLRYLQICIPIQPRCISLTGYQFYIQGLPKFTIT